MDNFSLLSILTFLVIGLVTLNALSYYVNKLIKLPDIILMLILGIIYGTVSFFTKLPLPKVDINPDIILFVLLEHKKYAFSIFAK